MTSKAVKDRIRGIEAALRQEEARWRAMGKTAPDVERPMCQRNARIARMIHVKFVEGARRRLQDDSTTE